jgi:hypothetical protein
MNFENTMQGMMSQLTTAFVGAIDIWLAVAVVVSLFAVAAFRPQQILDHDRFRKAALWFGYYLVVPTFLAVLAGSIRAGGPAQFFLSASVLTGRVLLALCILWALRSLLPER